MSNLNFPQRKRQIKVVIGSVEENLSELISECVKEIINDRFDLTLKTIYYGEELMKIAENDDVDIFIVVVNSIRFHPSYSPQERIEKSLQLITQIKKTYGKPVIALSGWLDNLALSAENIMKAGADFYFPLPVNHDFKAALEDEMKRIGATKADQLPGDNVLSTGLDLIKQKKYIIFVDSHEDIAAFVSNLIKESYGDNIQVFPFKDGKPALGFIKSNQDKIDLIISDLRITPDFNGTELLKMCKTLNRNIPFLIYTAYEEFAADVLALGAEAYIVKSASTDELMVAVAKYLSLTMLKAAKKSSAGSGL